jgi:hypothetical protein
MPGNGPRPQTPTPTASSHAYPSSGSIVAQVLFNRQQHNIRQGTVGGRNQCINRAGCTRDLDFISLQLVENNGEGPEG